MTTFIAVCLGLITLELAILIVALLLAFLRVRSASKAVEIVAYRLEEKIVRFSSNAWMRALQGAVSVAGGFLRGRRRD
ncbi:MAG: hypothetical protein A3J74_09195 [Elusimicrobia bacterium RIFCSPHIGHO2_02_FULL_57_9]|nr:MAG: hypothetical protein A3J74_09195 [Elusimicrobia bacterium RIFCSPHIGHO2_02_FULL_57_9]